MSKAITMPVEALPKTMRTANAPDFRDRGKVPSKCLPCPGLGLWKITEGIALIDSTSKQRNCRRRGGGARNAPLVQRAIRQPRRTTSSACPDAFVTTGTSRLLRFCEIFYFRGRLLVIGFFAAISAATLRPGLNGQRVIALGPLRLARHRSQDHRCSTQIRKCRCWARLRGPTAD